MRKEEALEKYKGKARKIKGHYKLCPIMEPLNMVFETQAEAFTKLLETKVLLRSSLFRWLGL